MQKVEFHIPDGFLAFGGIAITSALNTETSEERLLVSTFGDQQQSKIIGVLQTVLDRERAKMAKAWEAEG